MVSVQIDAKVCVLSMQHLHEKCIIGCINYAFTPGSGLQKSIPVMTTQLSCLQFSISTIEDNGGLTMAGNEQRWEVKA